MTGQFRNRRMESQRIVRERKKIAQMAEEEKLERNLLNCCSPDPLARGTEAGN